MLKRFLLALMALLALVLVTVAQDTDELPSFVAAAETGAEITWPLPVSEVWDVIPIIGTANVADMAYYYIEAAALNDQMTIPAEAPWIPLTAGMSDPVVNDVLATINTRDGVDGLYALRLTLNTLDGQQYTDIISPIRLNNERFALEVDYIRSQLEQGIDPGQPAVELPLPTEPEDPTPRVTPNEGLNAVNVRRCDLVDNDRCPVVGFLGEGQEANVLATSANGTGWYNIQLLTGNSGWVSPTVVTPLGDFSNVSIIAPPVPLNPPPPVVVVPPPQPIPTSSVTINGMSIVGGRAVCNEPFNVHINVTNRGNANSNPGTVTLQDVHIGTGTITYTGSGNYPSLTPGANFVVVIPVNTSVYYNEQHELRTFTNGQQFNIRYTLEQGNCGAPPPPSPPPPQQPPVVTFNPGECTVNARANAPLYDQPNGNQIGMVGPKGATFNVIKGTRINGEIWYELQGEMDNPGGWIRNRDAPFNQSVCQI